ncbi:hypothetical protein GSI_07899 [Ganoderma sinense ZZ0214-1]|uniref:Uncharacterized protein n=1 Tax=Ganoderma sinense ZZ0214-1 TaxID=1077348 RepID=A0A2G8S8X6_9APHY|nr:hypothetical protein GSI_07899 [Ganoderma sinense ZZ0214-1]
MSANDATDSNSGWSSTSTHLLGTDENTTSDNGKPIDVSLDHDMSAPSRREYSSLLNYWPILVAGLAWLAHLHYRQYYPRRLPHFTPLKPLELYAAAGLAGSVLAEQHRFVENIKRDHDLLVLTCFAMSLRQLWMVHQVQFKDMKHLHTEM